MAKYLVDVYWLLYIEADSKAEARKRVREILLNPKPVGLSINVKKVPTVKVKKVKRK